MEDNYPTNFRLLDKFATFHCILARIHENQLLAMQQDFGRWGDISSAFNYFGQSSQMQPIQRYPYKEWDYGLMTGARPALQPGLRQRQNAF